MEYIIEAVFSLGLFINAVLFIPQIIRLKKSKSSKGVSFITFFGFLLIQLSTVFHGLLKHDNLLVMGTLLSMLTCGCVTWLVVYYRLKPNKDA